MNTNNRGAVLVTVVIFSAVAIVLAGALFFASGSQMRAAEGMKCFEQAFFIAEAGIHMTAAELVNNPDGIDGVLAGADGILGTADDGLLTFDFPDGGLINVTVSNSVWPDTVIAVSKGEYWGRLRVVEAALRLDKAIAPPVSSAGALAVYGENTKIDMTGSSMVDGSDRDPPNVPGPGQIGDGTINTNLSIQPGIYSTPTSTVVNIDGSAEVDGDPSQVHGGSAPYTEEQYVALAEYLIGRPDNVLNGGVYGGQLVLGTRENPAVTIITGDSKITGDTLGAGVLILTAGMEIDFAGTFYFEGLVILMGDGVQSHSYELNDKGNCSILGSVVCVGDEMNIKLTGNSMIGYSSAALANLVNLNLSSSDRVALVYWKETKPGSM